MPMSQTGGYKISHSLTTTNTRMAESGLRPKGLAFPSLTLHSRTDTKGNPPMRAWHNATPHFIVWPQRIGRKGNAHVQTAPF